jgi:hypothetical protein
VFPIDISLHRKCRLFSPRVEPWCYSAHYQLRASRRRSQFHPTRAFGWCRARSEKGHEDQFLPLSLGARSVIMKQTVAVTRGNERDAPKADLLTSARRLLHTPRFSDI